CFLFFQSFQKCAELSASLRLISVKTFSTHSVRIWFFFGGSVIFSTGFRVVIEYLPLLLGRYATIFTKKNGPFNPQNLGNALRCLYAGVSDAGFDLSIKSPVDPSALGYFLLC